MRRFEWFLFRDKELALDLADDEACREYLEADYYKQGVNPEQCRDQELTTMMRDVQKWLRDGEYK
uniref:DUF3456 domain-containing protein n=1 Tax=Heterorhabditis bacteriophora TaxID=37862 RepID=A0A1I7X9S8_HETBA